MNHKFRIMLPAVFVFLLAGCIVTGCAKAPESEPPNINLPLDQTGNPTTKTISAAVSAFGEPAQWPDYIPDDIPVLQGDIASVMEGGSHIRLFYRNVTKDQVLDYLDLLKSLGFNLEYRIYVQEGFPDNSEKREKLGDFDAVDITRGDYHMNITYGPDPVYDVYTSGFQEQAAAATTLQWPAEIPASVPQPPNCVLVSVDAGADGIFNLSCKKETDDVETAYQELLLAAGFQQKDRTTVGDIAIETTVFENGEAVVLPNFGFSPTIFSIQVYRIPEPTQWPEALIAVVPQPAQCKIGSILSVSPSKYLINCSFSNEDFLTDYTDVLAQTAFAETAKFVDANNRIISVTMENRFAKVQLLNSALESSLLIDIELIQP